MLESVDKISDKEAKRDFEDLDDMDIDNDGDTDKSDKYLHKKLGMVAKMDESKNDTVIFSVNDDKLDSLLHDHHGRELDFTTIRGDEFYVLPRREFDRFMDAADSKGFDVDYDNSEDSVIAVEENTTVSESNDLGVEEPHYVEISVRDSRKAADIINDVPMLKNAIRRDIIVTYGSNVYGTKNQTMFRMLMDVLEDSKIEISSSSSNEDDPQYTWKESSTTGNVAGYDSPNAFGKQSDKDIEVLGYKKVPKKDINMKEGKQSTYRKMMSSMHSINEVSYRAYKNDESATPVQKVNKGIQEVNKMIAEMENIVNLNLRLKTESDVNSSQFWKSTSKRFTKINERLIRISNKLKELSK